MFIEERRVPWFRVIPEGLSVAEMTLGKFLARAVWLYEHEQGESFGSPRLGLYVRRWYMAFMSPTLNLLMFVSFLSVVGTTSRKVPA